MQKISEFKILPVLSLLLTLALIAKIIGLFVWWYLPSETEELHAQNSYLPTYQRVDFKNMLNPVKQSIQESEPQETTGVPVFSIESLVLKGLYGSRLNGFAIVAKKSAQTKTAIVSVGEIYAGYKLKSIASNYVVFTKNAKEYTLKLNKSSTTLLAKYKRQASSNAATEEISEASVSREDIHKYSKNPAQIWKDIAIAPVKKSGKIVGFKVNRIKAGSKMVTLGLKKGDIIIKANNVVLSSFRDAIKLYQNINKIDTIALVVIRNRVEKEIIYEIH